MTQPAFTPYTNFRFGNITFPLANPAVNSLVQDADPAVFFALDFYTYLIQTYVGARLVAEAQTADLPIVTSVRHRYPLMPGAALDMNQYQFPLLAIGRESADWKRKTASWENSRCTFRLLYAVPPMTAGQGDNIVPIFNAIAKLLAHKTTQGGDPGYTPPGGTLGQQPWFASLAGVEEIGFDGYEIGQMEGTGDHVFPALLMKGYILEKDVYLSDGLKYAGADITGSLIAPDGTTAANPFVQGSSQVPPTITSLSVTSGPHAGGTSVTLTGTLFLPKPVIFFGPIGANIRATSVVWNSATSVTCTSPAVSGSGTVDVSLFNRDMQLATLPQSFTYT